MFQVIAGGTSIAIAARMSAERTLTSSRARSPHSNLTFYRQRKIQALSRRLATYCKLAAILLATVFIIAAYKTYSAYRDFAQLIDQQIAAGYLKSHAGLYAAPRIVERGAHLTQDQLVAALVCAVWIGFDDNEQLGLTGAEAALPAWIDFMKAALAIRPSFGGTNFTRPSGITSVKIDPETGWLAGPNCPSSVLVSVSYNFAPGIECFKHSPAEPELAEAELYDNTTTELDQTNYDSGESDDSGSITPDEPWDSLPDSKDKSFVPERNHRIYLRGASRRNPASQQCN